MLRENVPIFFDHTAVVDKVTRFHAYIRLMEGPEAGSRQSVFINAIRLPGCEAVCTSLEETSLKIGQEVKSFYAQVNERIVILFLVAEGAKKPSLIEVQDLANDLVHADSRIQKRLVKTIESSDSGKTPDHLKSAISLPSPIDMRDVLTDHQQLLNAHVPAATAAGHKKN